MGRVDEQVIWIRGWLRVVARFVSRLEPPEDSGTAPSGEALEIGLKIEIKGIRLKDEEKKRVEMGENRRKSIIFSSFFAKKKIWIQSLKMFLFQWKSKKCKNEKINCPNLFFFKLKIRFFYTKSIGIKKIYRKFIRISQKILKFF